MFIPAGGNCGCRTPAGKGTGRCARAGQLERERELYRKPRNDCLSCGKPQQAQKPATNRDYARKRNQHNAAFCGALLLAVHWMAMWMDGGVWFFVLFCCNQLPFPVDGGCSFPPPKSRFFLPFGVQTPLRTEVAAAMWCFTLWLLGGWACSAGLVRRGHQLFVVESSNVEANMKQTLI